MSKIKIIIHLETDDDPIGVKECFSADCEKYGDVKMIEVEADE